MTAQSRIKTLQILINVILKARGESLIVDDGIIGRKTLTAFGKAYCLSNIQVVHTFANLHHESGGFTLSRENLNYSSVDRLMQIFGTGRHSAAISRAEAQSLINNPYGLAERVYGLGNPRKARELGNVLPGDGFKYRGGGPIQITGRNNYRQVGQVLMEDLENNPDLINNETYFTSGFAWLQANNVYPLMKDLTQLNINQVRRRINGGLNGIDDVTRLIGVYRRMLSI